MLIDSQIVGVVRAHGMCGLGLAVVATRSGDRQMRDFIAASSIQLSNQARESREEEEEVKYQIFDRSYLSENEKLGI